MDIRKYMNIVNESITATPKAEPLNEFRNKLSNSDLEAAKEFDAKMKVVLDLGYTIPEVVEKLKEGGCDVRAVSSAKVLAKVQSEEELPEGFVSAAKAVYDKALVAIGIGWVALIGSTFFWLPPAIAGLACIMWVGVPAFIVGGGVLTQMIRGDTEDKKSWAKWEKIAAENPGVDFEDMPDAQLISYEHKYDRKHGLPPTEYHNESMGPAKKSLNEFFKGKKTMAQEFPDTPYANIGSDGKEAKGYCPDINNHPWYNKLVYMLDVNYRDQFSQADANQLAHDIGQELGYSTASVYQYATMDEY